MRPCRDLLRALAGPPLGVLALGLAGCTTSTAKPTGVVTGVAYACEGAVLPPGTILHVTVSLQGSAAVASETVRSGAKYRFSVPPGVYQMIGWWGSRRVIVRAGHVVTANFMNTCI